METWNVFSASDFALALIGLAGFASVFVVLKTAFSNMNKRELGVKRSTEGENYAASRARGTETTNEHSV